MENDERKDVPRGPVAPAIIEAELGTEIEILEKRLARVGAGTLGSFFQIMFMEWMAALYIAYA